MEDIDGGLHPAVDGQSLDEDEDKEHYSKTFNYRYVTNENEKENFLSDTCETMFI